jgi:YfiH family protein
MFANENAEFEHVLEAGLSFWRRSSWIERGIEHGFLGRSLDIRRTPKAWNRFSDKPLYLLEQVHGKKFCSRASVPPTKADAWVLAPSCGRTAEQAYGIITADCVPVLLYCRKSRIIAAAHCGWRSACSGLLPIVIAEMIRLGANIDDIDVTIGPSALGCCYEIGQDVWKNVSSAFPRDLGNQQRFSRMLEERKGKLFCEIGLLLEAQAIACGLAPMNISRLPLCTICDNRFFSYRREKAEAGRQLSFIFGSCA